jgi:hypothetical protein
MYNAGKIVIGLIIFLALILSPLLFNVGKTATPPKLEVGTKEKECVESIAYMKSSHMQLLNTWRDEVVRSGKREYVSTTGKKYEMSLQNTCTKCHAKKEQFCDRCHTYVDASPKCWDCHIAPQPEKQAAPQEKQARRSDN